MAGCRATCLVFGHRAWRASELFHRGLLPAARRRVSSMRTANHIPEPLGGIATHRTAVCVVRVRTCPGCHCRNATARFKCRRLALTEPHLCPLYALCANLKCFSNTCRVHGARFNFHHQRPAAASTRLVATRDVLLATKQRKASVPTLAPSCAVVMSQLRDASAPFTYAG